jgi:hypothetical protein
MTGKHDSCHIAERRHHSITINASMVPARQGMDLKSQARIRIKFPPPFHSFFP